MHDDLQVTKKLGTAIPIICTAAFGLMGRDVATNSFKEVFSFYVDINLCTCVLLGLCLGSAERLLSRVVLVQIPQWGEEEEEDYFNNWQFYDPSAFLNGDYDEILNHHQTDFNHHKTNRNAAVMLTVGFLPGMKVAAVTLSQSKKV